jgi:E3 ubiquitin-protein ligase RNF14
MATARADDDEEAAAAAAAADNWRLQLDEVTALASIYEGDARVLRWPWSEEEEEQGDMEGEEEQQEQDGDADSSALLRALERAAGRANPPPPTAPELTVELLVHVDVPPERGVQVALSAGGAEEAATAPFRFAPLIKHLPPIRIAARLPRLYPGASAPSRLEVRAAWLGEVTARRLERALLPLGRLAAAEEQEEGATSGGVEGSEASRWRPGEPVLFGWAEFLRERALFEAAEKEDEEGEGPLVLVLHHQEKRKAVAAWACDDEDEGEDDEDDDANPVDNDDDDDDDQPQELLAMRLQRYSAAREAEAFARRQAVCGICFEASPGTSHLRRLTPECEQRHRRGETFCRGCLKAHAESVVAQGSLNALCCPSPDCRAPIPADVLRDELLSRESFERWERLLLSRSLSRMADVVWCPRCATAAAAGSAPVESPCIEDPEDRLAQCERCGFAFCGICAQAWHPGRPCLDEEARLLVLSARTRRTGGVGGGGGEDGADAPPRDARREADAAAQLLSLRAIRQATRPCPGCGAASVRSEGCNKMTCPSCGALWCWRCGADISHAGYDHFKQQQGQQQQGQQRQEQQQQGQGQEQGQQAPEAAPAPPPTTNPSTPVGCRLFEQEEIDRWQRRMEQHEREQAMAAAREGLLPAGQAGAAAAAAGLGGEFDAELQAALEADAAARLLLRRRQQGGGADAAAAADVAAARAAARDARRRAMSALRRAAAVCPVCGQVNARHRGGANLVRCWSCMSHFCAACRSWLRTRPVAAHFRGKGACPQHAGPAGAAVAKPRGGGA